MSIPRRAVRQRIYLSSQVAGAEAVIDIDNRDARSAAVEHRQQRCYTFEGGAVANGGWHSHDWRRDQTRDDAGQSAFHARQHDKHVGRSKFVEMVEKTV